MVDQNGENALARAYPVSDARDHRSGSATNGQGRWTQAAKEVSSRKRKAAEKVESGITERGQYDRKKRRDSAVDEEEESAGVVCTGDEVEGEQGERDRGWLQVVLSRRRWDEEWSGNRTE